MIFFKKCSTESLGLKSTQNSANQILKYGGWPHSQGGCCVWGFRWRRQKEKVVRWVQAMTWSAYSTLTASWHSTPFPQPPQSPASHSVHWQTVSVLSQKHSSNPVSSTRGHPLGCAMVFCSPDDSHGRLAGPPASYLAPPTCILHKAGKKGFWKLTTNHAFPDLKFLSAPPCSRVNTWIHRDPALSRLVSSLSHEPWVASFQSRSSVQISLLQRSTDTGLPSTVTAPHCFLSFPHLSWSLIPSYFKTLLF